MQGGGGGGGGGVHYVFQTRPTVHCKVLKFSLVLIPIYIYIYIYISLSTYLSIYMKNALVQPAPPPLPNLPLLCSFILFV